MTRLRVPGSRFARRPVAPFLLAGFGSVAAVVVVNDLLLSEPLWHVPHFVAIVGPMLASMASAALRMAATRSIDPEELLTRPLVRLDPATCAPALAGKRILITGAAGSIGSELARQVGQVQPACIVAVDINETGLYELEADLAAADANRRGAVPLTTCIADVADGPRMRELFLRERPDLVFHAAAYKHVPLVEANPGQGFLINVLGTLSVCEAAAAANVERVVVISTDKAVNPVSFMGLTKRVAELMVIALGPRLRPGITLSAVRFGNVLGSRGSLLPTLLRQIESGGPITITHPDVERFFMTVSEAASLVLLSAADGTPGGLLVLDMGHEVRVEELAERLVRLKGLRPGRDIATQYIGLRAGEKMHEELHSADERLVPTGREAVWRVEPIYSVDADALLEGIHQIESRRHGGAIVAEDYPGLVRELIGRVTRQQHPISV
jgi:FlaA1/EpsC-like NDP-sugar epimerase